MYVYVYICIYIYIYICIYIYVYVYCNNTTNNNLYGRLGVLRACARTGSAIRCNVFVCVK